MIQKQKVRKSLKTPPDETITVNFVPRQSNVKKSFPVTHTRLLKDDDLSSPGEWGDRAVEIYMYYETTVCTLINLQNLPVRRTRKEDGAPPDLKN